MEVEAVCGQNMPGLYGLLDLNTLSLRTPQLSLLEDSEEFSVTFPKSGMMQNGNVYRQKALDTLTREKDSMLLPTPNATDGHFGFLISIRENLEKYMREHQNRLAYILRLKNLNEKEIVTIYELIMNFPLGWTELPAVEMQLSQK